MLPYQRNLKKFYEVLVGLNAKGLLHYQLYKYRTIEKWHTLFKWEERYYEKVHRECEELDDLATDVTKRMYINNSNNALHFNSFVVKLQNLCVSLVTDLDPSNRDNVQTLVQLGNLTKNIRQLQEGSPINLNETFAMIKVLHKTDSELADELETRIDELVNDGLVNDDNSK